MTDTQLARLLPGAPGACAAQPLAGRGPLPPGGPPASGGEPALDESVGPVGPDAGPSSPSLETHSLLEQVMPVAQAPLSSSPSQSSSKRLHVSDVGGPGRQSLALQVGL
jgi:hypothetical protein